MNTKPKEMIRVTGRRLYELFCDGWANQSKWNREHSSNRLGLPESPVAWPFLSYCEKNTFNRAAARLKGVRR